MEKGECAMRIVSSKLRGRNIATPSGLYPERNNTSDNMLARKIIITGTS
jgi:hypothetical protein